MQPVSEYNFDNFIIGRSNQLAFLAAKDVAYKPGETNNPLFIYSKSGLGKTHLLNAIYKHIHKTSPDLAVFMVTADELVLKMINAIETKQIDEWRRSVLSSDVLLIDDAHILMGKEFTQAEFVYLIRNCVKRKHQVVLTASVDPEKLPVLESSLRSDFDRGLCADIQPIDIATCRLVAIDKAARSGLSLSDELLEYIISHSNGDARRIEGVINSLYAGKKLLNFNLDLTSVKCLHSQRLQNNLHNYLDTTDVSPFSPLL